MSKLYRWIHECAACHAENGDNDGAEAIMYGAKHGRAAAVKRYPGHVPAIDNAFAYARQEAA